MSFEATTTSITMSTSTQTTRTLFLEEYIASDCTTEFDPNTSVDDTIGTYATNYLIGVLGILFGMLFLAKAYGCCCIGKLDTSPTTTQTQTTSLFYQALYFLLAAAGYGIAGFQHQFYHTRESLPPALVLGAGALVALSMVPLQLSITEAWETSKWTRLSIRLVHVVVAATIVILTIVLETLFYVGVFNLLVFLWTAGYYIRCFFCSACQTMRYVVATGHAAIIAGFLVQVLLTPACGSEEAYENCFRECPLPTDPLVFNHNALFHALVAIGMVFQAVGWWWWPMPESNDDDASDDKLDTTGKVNASFSNNV